MLASNYSGLNGVSVNIMCCISVSPLFLYPPKLIAFQTRRTKFPSTPIHGYQVIHAWQEQSVSSSASIQPGTAENRNSLNNSLNFADVTTKFGINYSIIISITNNGKILGISCQKLLASSIPYTQRPQMQHAYKPEENSKTTHK